MRYCDIHTHRKSAPSADFILRNLEPDAPHLPSQGCFSMGIHPWKVDASWPEKFQTLSSLATSPAVLAIGETGLDKLVPSSPELQKEAFLSQIELAETLQKPLIIHCVKAWNEMIELKKKQKATIPWIIHGFRGKKKLARQLLDAGFFLSFGYYFQPEALAEAWPERLFTETDDSGADIRQVYVRLLEALHLPEKDFARQILENVERCFSI